MIPRIFAITFVLLVGSAACGSAETLIYTEVPEELVAQQQQFVQEAAVASLTARGQPDALQELEMSATLDPAPTIEASPTPGPIAQDAPEIPLTQAEVDGSNLSPALGFEPGDPNLKASNPASVNLASGQIQLIEFW